MLDVGATVGSVVAGLVVGALVGSAPWVAFGVLVVEGEGVGNSLTVEELVVGGEGLAVGASVVLDSDTFSHSVPPGPKIMGSSPSPSSSSSSWSFRFSKSFNMVFSDGNDTNPMVSRNLPASKETEASSIVWTPR